MSDLPLEPQLAKMLLISPEYNCSNEVRTRHDEISMWHYISFYRMPLLRLYAVLCHTILIRATLFDAMMPHTVPSFFALCHTVLFFLLYPLLCYDRKCCGVLLYTLLHYSSFDHISYNVLVIAIIECSVPS